MIAAQSQQQDSVQIVAKAALCFDNKTVSKALSITYLERNVDRLYWFCGTR